MPRLFRVGRGLCTLMFIRLVAAGILLVISQCSNGGVPAGRPEGSAPSQAPSPTGVASLIPRQELLEAMTAARRAAASDRAAGEARDADALYARGAGAPIWIDTAGRLTAPARAGLTLLSQAASQGLDPAAFGAERLVALARDLDGPGPVPAALAAKFDVLMTAGVLRYFRHVHLGRVDPKTLDLQLTIPAEQHDFAEIVRTAIDRGRLAESAAEMEPPLQQYSALKTMLARYRALAASVEATPTFTGTVRPGDHFDDLATLQRLLVTLGDLPGDAPVSGSGIYDDSIRAGIARFQERHGLDTDGIIGPATREALGVPLSWRARQIELALERLRWLPDLSQARSIAVNIPMFRLWAWDGDPSDTPALTMAVIVGRTLNRTPVFADEMEFVIFRPYWNVPSSILRSESIPAIRRNPGYLAREGMEIVRGQTDSAPVLAPSPENIAALGAGDVRLRQRPGPRNALGLVKFMFPNQNDVYMHDTPAQQLFERSRRDFSHGCIRVENPIALAEWALGRDPSWTRDRIVAAMNGDNNQRVDLPEPIQVVIFYTTAVVVPEDESLHFAKDLYGHDLRLDKAL